MTETPLLSVEGVAVDLPTARGNLRAVDSVDLSLGAGRTLGIVGESGCGKTMFACETGESRIFGQSLRAIVE